MLYIINEYCGVRGKSIDNNISENASRGSLGSIDINNLSKVFDNYFELSDKKTERKERLLIVYDGVFQTAFHLNMKVEDRIRHDKSLSLAYKTAVAFAADKITECIENLKIIYDMMKIEYGNDIIFMESNKLNEAIGIYNNNINKIKRCLDKKDLRELDIL